MMKPEAFTNEGVEVDTARQPQSHIAHDYGPVLRAATDDLSVWQSVRRFKKVGYIAMAAAFCASLDGYRKLTLVYIDVCQTLM